MSKAAFIFRWKTNSFFLRSLNAESCCLKNHEGIPSPLTCEPSVFTSKMENQVVAILTGDCLFSYVWHPPPFFFFFCLNGRAGQPWKAPLLMHMNFKFFSICDSSQRRIMQGFQTFRQRRGPNQIDKTNKNETRRGAGRKASRLDIPVHVVSSPGLFPAELLDTVFSTQKIPLFLTAWVFCNELQVDLSGN